MFPDETKKNEIKEVLREIMIELKAEAGLTEIKGNGAIGIDTTEKRGFPVSGSSIFHLYC
ncbi:hypothetical protein [Peribacillus muralis]|uniref:hypothetical protein n=1 Tax=Peribacillus muralis TaxID=264697 RepID=UPI003CFF74C7